jgi:hypothetical protein
VDDYGKYQLRISIKETDLQILADRPIDNAYVKERINVYRRDIEDYITRDGRFLTALKPLAVELYAPLIVKRMAKASGDAGVGPMAAVAGAIAEFLGRDLLRNGCKDIIIENGGDIFLSIRRACKVAIYGGPSSLFKGLNLKIKAEDTPIGICTSSGTLGHSLSFGQADSVTILSKNASLADAVATAAANRIKSPKDLEKALDFARSIKGVSGITVIMKKRLMSWGRVQFASVKE